MLINPFIIDSSKVLMQDFHYDFIKNQCGKKVAILPTDTEAEYVYEDFYKDKELIDFSSYPEDFCRIKI